MLVKASTKFNIYSELSYLLDAQHWIPSTPILFTVDPVGDFVDHKLKMVGMWVGVLVAGLRTGEIGEIWIPVQPTFRRRGQGTHTDVSFPCFILRTSPSLSVL